MQLLGILFQVQRFFGEINGFVMKTFERAGVFIKNRVINYNSYCEKEISAKATAPVVSANKQNQVIFVSHLSCKTAVSPL